MRFLLVLPRARNALRGVLEQGLLCLGLCALEHFPAEPIDRVLKEVHHVLSVVVFLIPDQPRLSAVVLNPLGFRGELVNVANHPAIGHPRTTSPKVPEIGPVEPAEIRLDHSTEPIVREDLG